MFLFQHSTLAWWAAVIGGTKQVGVYGPWRPYKEKGNKVKEIQKNSREIIRISDSEYQGHKFIDCRIFYDDSGDWKPTKKGISFSHKIAHEVVEAIVETMEESNWNEFKTN